MTKVSEWITTLNRRIGHATAWLAVILILVIIVDVSLRYAFNITSVATGELEWHLFAALFLLSSAWTLSEDKHVRVDVFYNRYSDRTKAIVNLLGTLFFLLPFCVIAISESIPFVTNSFGLRETSPDPGGLPARYIIKSMIPIGFTFLGLQAISEMLKSISILINKES